MIYVPSHGPFTAKLLFVGEGPGKTEELKKQPFVGMTGDFVRGCVRRAGLDPDEVRWANAVGVRCKVPGDVNGRLRLLAKWTDLETDLMRCQDAKVVVACGGLALLRLTGMTNITNAAGQVVQADDGRLVVPVLHPAGVMRGKIQAERLTIQRHIERAVRLATGELTWKPVEPTIIDVLNAGDFRGIMEGVGVVVIDTEFNPDTKTTRLVGFTTDDTEYGTVYQIAGGWFDMEMIHEWDKVLKDPDIRKVAHFHKADRDALEWVGCDVDGARGWFDTLAAFSTLYPDLPCGLSHVARFYLDNIGDWKSMEKDDPVYNALDVVHTFGIYRALCEDLALAGMWDVFETEVMPTLPHLYALQDQGIQVDKKECRRVRGEYKKEVKRLTKEIKGEVEGVFNARREPLHQQIGELEQKIQQAEDDAANGAGGCEVHPTYTGLRKKRWAADDKCTCESTFTAPFCGGLRDVISTSRSEIRKAKDKLAKWEKGFDPDNNDHLRWLLYDRHGLGLPVQKHPQTKRATADATAVAKLAALKGVQRKKGVVELLHNIKRVQHLKKMISTFLKPPVDKDWVVHPPYRMHGTGTGRPAGGDDVMLHEKGMGAYKFNALNIPDECRRIYVPFTE